MKTLFGYLCIPILWAIVGIDKIVHPSKLPRCPRCGKRLGALDENHEKVCPRKDERCCSCVHNDCIYSGPELGGFCGRNGSWVVDDDWCKDWKPRKERPR